MTEILINEELESCILCSQPCVCFHLKSCRPEELGGKDSVEVESEADLSPQLRVIFLLQQVFKYPVHDETTLEALQVLGDPSEWFGVCETCSGQIDEGIHLLRKLRRIEEKFRLTVEKLARKCSKSLGGEDLNPGEKHVGGFMKFGGRQVEKSWKRKEFRNKVRQRIVEIKLDPDCISEVEETWMPTGDTNEFAERALYDYPLKVELDEYKNEQSFHESHQGSLEQLSPGESSIILDTCSITKDKTSGRASFQQLQIEEEEEGCILKGDNADSEEDSDPNIEDEDMSYREENDVFENEDEDISENEEKDMTENEDDDMSYKYNEDDGSSESEDDDDMSENEDDDMSENEDDDMSENEDDDMSENDGDELGTDSTISSQQISVKKRKRNNLKSSRAILRAKYKQFYDTCHQYLDMSLVEYPPPSKSENEKSKITKNGVFPCTHCHETFSRDFEAIAHIHSAHLGVTKPWKCNQCPYKNKRLRSLQLHLKHHENGRVKICKLCNWTTKRGQISLDFHFINHQKGCPNPKCPECDQTFRTFVDYVKHMTGEHNYLYYHVNGLNAGTRHLVCELCSEKINTPRGLEFHMFTVHNRGVNDGKFPSCSECGQIFLTKMGLLGHQKSNVHGGGYFCEYCGKSFSSIKSLLNHKSFTHSSKTYKCEICGLFLKHARRNEHLHKHHSETKSMSPEELKEYIGRAFEKMEFKCSYDGCSEAFPFKHLLYRHVVSYHAKDDGSVVKCEDCGKLSKHFQCDEAGTRRFCEHCGKEYLFIVKNTWLKEIKLKQKIEASKAEEMLECLVCSMMIKRSQMDSHVKENHRETRSLTMSELEEYVRKKKEEMGFKCSRCPERFPFSVLLYHHYRKSHSNKYKCDLCGKGFTRANGVTIHKKSVHSNFRVPCEDCGGTFSSKGKLTRHKRKCKGSNGQEKVA